jgi:hypothetical protein
VSIVEFLIIIITCAVGGFHNATLWAGRNIITSHLHSLKVTPFSDYNGARFGVDTGTLANPYSEQFNYQEDNPRNHRRASWC